MVLGLERLLRLFPSPCVVEQIADFYTKGERKWEAGHLKVAFTVLGRAMPTPPCSREACVEGLAELAEGSCLQAHPAPPKDRGEAQVDSLRYKRSRKD